ncbi:hypothetical protein SAMN05444410_1091 [Hydrobacter penzbergensis]|uniref:Uncharacterized protein n=1 Tax=Hydrobacter penzbergensis TaxID=1235997 RepID=A0A8X8IGL2_9BACT|nr:hypothetical protein [Hydrobacter penzbergensis]SDX08870.1 hypothetical protein SAMN05444410_1091 [Hydrobacter penzbergensis]
MQIINTTDQKTIDTYFNELLAELQYIDRLLTPKCFIEKITVWNEETLKRYTEIIESEVEDYFKNENRKRKHLEEYEDWNFSFSMFGLRGKSAQEKVKRINYNFYCIEETPDLINEEIIDDYIAILKSLRNELFETALKYGIPWSEGTIKSKVEEQSILKPIIFVEGEHDIKFINKAAILLGKEDLLAKIELRQRGGYGNLDKLWNILKEGSWETIPQIRIFLYDCDTNKTNDEFGNHYKRIIPLNANNIVKRGIENLFPNTTIDKALSEKQAFIDFKKIMGTKRGIVYEEIQNEINKDEKRNFCDWVCANGIVEDFENFKVIFEIIEELI